MTILAVVEGSVNRPVADVTNFSKHRPMADFHRYIDVIPREVI